MSHIPTAAVFRPTPGLWVRDNAVRKFGGIVNAWRMRVRPRLASSKFSTRLRTETRLDFSPSLFGELGGFVNT
jgi:hypothetical protein